MPDQDRREAEPEVAVSNEPALEIEATHAPVVVEQAELGNAEVAARQSSDFDPFELTADQQAIVAGARDAESSEDRSSVLAQLLASGASQAEIDAIAQGQNGFWDATGSLVQDGELHMLLGGEDGSLSNRLDFEDSELSWENSEGYNASAGYNQQNGTATVRGGREGVAEGRLQYDTDSGDATAGVGFHAGDIEGDVSTTANVNGESGSGRLSLEGEDWSTVVEGSGNADGASGEVTVVNNGITTNVTGNGGGDGGGGSVAVSTEDWGVDASGAHATDSTTAHLGGNFEVGDHAITAGTDVTAHRGDNGGTSGSASVTDVFNDNTLTVAANGSSRDNGVGGGGDIDFSREGLVIDVGGSGTTTDDGTAVDTHANVEIGANDVDTRFGRTADGTNSVGADYHHTLTLGDDRELVVGGGGDIALGDHTTGTGRADFDYTNGDTHIDGDAVVEHGAAASIMSRTGAPSLLGDETEHGTAGRLSGTYRNGTDTSYGGNLALGQVGDTTMFGAGFDITRPDFSLSGTAGVASNSNGLAGAGSLDATVPVNDDLSLGFGASLSGNSMEEQLQWAAHADATLQLPSDLELMMRTTVMDQGQGAMLVPEARLSQEDVFSTALTGYVPLGDTGQSGGAMLSAGYDPLGISAYGAVGDPRGVQFDSALTSLPGMNDSDVLGTGGPAWEVGFQADLIKLFSGD
jgi:hypothetical protein